MAVLKGTGCCRFFERMRHGREDGNSPIGKDTLNPGPAQAGESLLQGGGTA